MCNSWRTTLDCGSSADSPYFEWEASNRKQALIEAIEKLKKAGCKRGIFHAYFTDASGQLNHKINSVFLIIRTSDDIKSVIKRLTKELTAYLQVAYLKHSSRFQASIRQGVCWMVGGTRKQNRVKFSRYALARMRLFVDHLLCGWRSHLIKFLKLSKTNWLEEKFHSPPPLERTPQIKPNAPAAA